jgi:NAD(P)-dependent dehydrogenase (short-subunit alcohol dehydrogenase family)
MKLLKLALYTGLTAFTVSKVVRYRRRMNFAGRNVLITGGSRGLGLAIAREFANQGARLALLARDPNELEQARSLLYPADVRTYPCDITDTALLRDTYAQARADLGDIDVIVNNAGSLTVAPESAMTDGDFDLSLRTNYLAPLALIRIALPFMRQRRQGRIINIASIGGKQPIPHMSAYAASKHALVGLSESLRAELVPHNIYVLTVCPGFLDNGAPLSVTYKGHPKQEYRWFADAAQSKAAADPADIARRIVQSARDGDAALTYPTLAHLQQSLHNLAPGISQELITLLSRNVLPDDQSPTRTPTKGTRLAQTEEADQMAIANTHGLRA